MLDEPQADPELCTEAEIERMVHAFYADIRRDEVLGPIFNGHVEDWDEHLALLTDFWSSLLRRTARFSGTPMAKHAALPELNAALFERWLGLFDQTLAVQPNRLMAARAGSVARRIAQSLWMGYQIGRGEDDLQPLGSAPLPRSRRPVADTAP